MWEYLFSEYPNYRDTLQNVTISDSTDSQGIIHITQHAYAINPIGSAIYLADTTKYWLDTAKHVVYGTIVNPGITLIYKLDAQKGEEWIDTSTRVAVKVIDKWEGNIFGKKTEFMRFRYYDINDFNDTLTWLDITSRTIADKFGLVNIGGSETFGEINLTGAVINDTLNGNVTPVAVKNERKYLPSSIKLNQNYPNPFNPETTILYSIPKESLVTIKVYDVLGKEIAALVNERKSRGNYSIDLNSSKLPSGIYFYRLISGTYSSTKKMVILK